MRRVLPTSSLQLLISVILVLATSSVGVWAFPFGKNSGVTELTPKTLNNFLNTHKPVFIMFYAPWCGHCKNMHPEYEKFGQGMKDVVRVGAINADQYKEIGGQFGIQGFPTIKYWKMGSKKGMKPLDYQGQRTKNGLHNAALAEITHAVKTAASAKQVNEAAAAASSGKAVVLFSSKDKPPPIFSVLSQSPHFKGKIGFVLVPEKAKDICSTFEVTKFPTILVVSKPAEGQTDVTKEAYSGAIDYTSIAKFLKAQLGETDSGDDSDASGTASESKKGSESKKESESKSKEEKKEKTEPVKNTRPATPVRPTKLTKENFETFCSYNAPKVAGQQPFCVIAFGQGAEFQTIYQQFERDSMLFFYTEDERALLFADAFQTGLQPSPPLGKDDVVALRAAKDRVKFATWRATDAHTAPGDTMAAWLERCLAGETTFDRHPGFPKLEF